MTEARRFELVLAASSHAELAAVEKVEEIGAWLNFPRDTLDEVKLAVVEACLNALEYGGGEIRVELEGRTGVEPVIEVSVIDAGPGFDPRDVRPPVLKDKLNDRRKRGWGLELIRCLMDRVEISSRPGRTRVTMVKGREGV